MDVIWGFANRQHAAEYNIILLHSLHNKVILLNLVLFIYCLLYCWLALVVSCLLLALFSFSFFTSVHIKTELWLFCGSQPTSSVVGSHSSNKCSYKYVAYIKYVSYYPMYHPMHNCIFKKRVRLVIIISISDHLDDIFSLRENVKTILPQHLSRFTAAEI